jgi:7-cyano-7-deazaguanine synthase
MCNVVAFWSIGKINTDDKLGIRNLVNGMSSRGRDGFGYAYFSASNEGLTTYKTLKDPKDCAIPSLSLNDRLILNTRAAPVTEGAPSIENCHPFVSEHWAVAHNGIITNDREIRNSLPFTSFKTNVDTEVIPHLLDIYDIEEVCEELLGGFSIAAISKSGALMIARNYKTLYHGSNRRLYVVASEASALVDNFPDMVVSEFPKESYAIIPLHPNRTPIEVASFIAKYIAHVPNLNVRKSLVICSGGMDSSTTAFIAKYMLDKDVVIMHFDYGQKSEGMEWWSVQRVAEELSCEAVKIDLKWLGELGHSPLTDEDIDVPLGRESSKSCLCWVPARNQVMLSVAAAYAEAKGIKYILYGSNLEEEGPSWKDNDSAAVEAFSNACFYGTLHGVEILNILGGLMKRDIIALGTHLGVPLDKTCSCDIPEQRDGKWYACGHCGCCQNRRHAYMQADLPDPQEYLYDMTETYPSVYKSGVDIDKIKSIVLQYAEGGIGLDLLENAKRIINL